MPALAPISVGRISKTWHHSTNDKRYTKPIGLYNDGALCYRNALLQCLLQTPVFYNCLGRIHFKCSKEANQCTTCALQGLAYDYWQDRSAPNFPRESAAILHEAVKDTCPLDDNFALNADGRRQADPIEFLQFLKNMLIKAGDSRTNRVNSVLQMRVEETGTCTNKKCRHQVLQTVESYWTTAVAATSLGKYNGLSLQDGVKASFREDIQAECEGCQAKTFTSAGQSSTRALVRRITQAPELLIVQIQRGFFDKSKGVIRKMMNSVPFDQDLDLSEFTNDGSELLYRLYGVVAHGGSTINAGHYIAAVRGHGGSSFWTVNDTVVRRNHRGSFKEMTDPRTTAKGQRCPPYLLIYQRVN
ncbi:hypothetical protein LTR17_019192 [Elasticomyces elasticus]|nr:hypothetical protein LTR17_019192 [Elasticomyces elasticus]